MNNNSVTYLYNQYLHKRLSTAELQELRDLLQKPEHEALFKEVMETGWDTLTEDELLIIPKEVEGRVLDYVVEQPQTEKKTLRLWPRMAGIAAAVIGIAICVWLYYSANTPRHPELVSGPPLANDIAPGGNRATLTSNGNTINLSEAKTGIVVNDDITYNDGTGIAPLSSRAHETSSGQAAAKDLDPSEVGMTKVTTPRGGTYSIILQDGTKVWLNADSKLEFLSNYKNSTQRIVKLTGEGYFEVAKNKAKPFVVESKGQRVEVLGTHFNINAYSNDTGIRTTLLEGSVRVSSTLSSRANAKDLKIDPSEVGMTKGRDGGITLKPGQQSLVTANNNITVKEVDVNTAIDWKNGQLISDGETLQSIMKKIERWYNVEVIYTDQQVAQVQFRGTLNRFDKLSKLLNLIESTKRVHFKIEQKKVFVSR